MLVTVSLILSIERLSSMERLSICIWISGVGELLVFVKYLLKMIFNGFILCLRISLEH